MQEAFFGFISQFGYIAIAGLILFENIFPPIPSELILPLSGFLVSKTSMTLPLVIAFATIGSVVGAYILYGFGRLLSQERLEGFFDTKLMRMLGFHSDDVAKAIGWFDRKGQIAVLICRCVPVVRSLISIPAGTAKMNMVRFALYTLVGSLAWNTVLCTLGFWAGDAWEVITAQAEWVSTAVKVAIVIIGLIVVAWWIKFRIIPAREEQKRRDAEGK
ncbi:DedA family protein [Collinsella provencensis]|uniref:DedA family protein n=1 Tax=Collinsella provencensis TaxID=1937461 RepID=UPI000C85FA56|nr:DedA family protein [Collinsella provencensis]